MCKILIYHGYIHRALTVEEKKVIAKISKIREQLKNAIKEHNTYIQFKIFVFNIHSHPKKFGFGFLTQNPNLFSFLNY